LDGSDYLSIAGYFASDDGTDRADNSPDWMEQGNVAFVPMIFDGEVYRAQDPVELWTPYQGDWNVSPSGNIAVSRVSGIDDQYNAVQMGFQLSFVEKTVADDTYSFALKPAATICLNGGKTGISYNERFLATFHYVSEEDYAEFGYESPDAPGFRTLLDRGAGNIYVYDLLNGSKKRVTTMGPGQFAMFPHFRSDGWLYFLVRDSNSRKRYVVATDATILME
jgi:hypothetical protein